MGFHGRSPVISSAFLRPVSRHGAVNNQIFIGYSLNLQKVIASVRSAFPGFLRDMKSLQRRFPIGPLHRGLGNSHKPNLSKPGGFARFGEVPIAVMKAAA